MEQPEAAVKVEEKVVYKKDDFFDTLSSESTERYVDGRRTFNFQEQVALQG